MCALAGQFQIKPCAARLHHGIDLIAFVRLAKHSSASFSSHQ
jgi:hypothetical protein